MTGTGLKSNAGLPPGAKTDDRAYADMIARAKALVPRLRDRASKTEELRRLPPETERELHEAGLFRIVQPKRVGGGELDYVALIDCADAMGQGDASVAWTFANLASHHWMLAMFDKRGRSRQSRANPAVTGRLAADFRSRPLCRLRPTRRRA